MAWLLIEHPGPWAAQIDETDLPSPVAGTLARARRHGIRVQLIRRPRRRRSTPPVQVYAGWSGADAWLEGRELADPAELAGLDLEAVAAGRHPGFGAPVSESLLLVCTNGRHNVCCARVGGPLARALHDRFGDAVWETTHLGGDRYAANLLCLPHGLYYGDLSLADGFTAATAYLRREVWLKRYRGRAGLPGSAQAAEHFLRSHTGMLRLDTLLAESVTEAPVSEVIIRCGLERYRVCVERVRLDGCGEDCKEDLSTYLLKDLTQIAGSTAGSN
jgi:hypothetical protein